MEAYRNKMFRSRFQCVILVVLFWSSTFVLGAESNVYFAYRSFWPEHETMKRFAAAGVHTYCVFPSNTTNSLGEPYSKYPANWRYPNSYDWNSLYRQFDEILAFDPDAEFLCMVDLNTPIWLTRMLGSYGDGSFDSFVDLSNCLASPSWRKQTEQYLVDFLTQTEQRYGDKIKAYILACGQTDEWMDYCAGRSSRVKLEAYKKWEQANGLSELPWPTFAELDAATFKNRVRDPKTEQNALQAQRFEQELVADTILDFAKLTKEKTNFKKEVGVFFGYILELTEWRAAGCGHLAYEKVFSSPDLDFFISPGSYSERLIGGGSGAMAPNETILLNGKRRLHETDHRTTTYNCDLNEYVAIAPIARWSSEDEDVAGLRRELCFALIDRASMWFFDMWGGSFKSDRAFENVATMKRVWDKEVGKQGERVAEVLLIADPQSLERVNDRAPKAGIEYLATRNRLNHIGAPYAVCSFNDLDKIDVSKIKLAILPGSYYLTQERRDLLREKLLRDGRTVLWIGPAGIDDGESIDVVRVKETTGLEFGKEIFAQVERQGFFGVGKENWKSALLSEIGDIYKISLKDLARQAGVAIYVEDESPVYASERLVAVHTKEGGVKKITLPRRVARVKEVFSDRVVAENTNAFEYEFAAPETALFELEY